MQKKHYINAVHLQFTITVCLQSTLRPRGGRGAGAELQEGRHPVCGGHAAQRQLWLLDGLAAGRARTQAGEGPGAVQIHVSVNVAGLKQRFTRTDIRSGHPGLQAVDYCCWAVATIKFLLWGINKVVSYGGFMMKMLMMMMMVKPNSNLYDCIWIFCKL